MTSADLPAGRLLNRAIAERIFGLEVEGEAVITDALQTTSDPGAPVNRLRRRQPMPPFSSDMGQAYTVARKLRHDVDQGRLPDETWAAFERHVLAGGDFWRIGNERAAELICRAALQALGSQGD